MPFLVRIGQVITLLIILLVIAGCASKPHSESTRKLSRDLPKSIKYYKVKAGDTLYSIGFRANYDYHLIAQWNKIKPPYKIKVGRVLKLFNPKARAKTLKKIKSTAKKKGTTSQKKLIISTVNKKVLKLHWQWPIKGKIIRNFYQTKKKGLDILGTYGQIVTSAASGKVVYSGNGLIGYGNLIIIKHNDEYLSAYANNSQLLVQEGQQVKRGQAIAKVGRVNDKKTILHFEIRKNGNPLNPVNLLP